SSYGPPKGGPYVRAGGSPRSTHFSTYLLAHFHLFHLFYLFHLFHLFHFFHLRPRVPLPVSQQAPYPPPAARLSSAARLRRSQRYAPGLHPPATAPSAAQAGCRDRDRNSATTPAWAAEGA